MNILQLVPQLNLGGVERGTLDLSRELVKQGHRSVVVSAGGRLLGELIKKGGRHYRIAVHRKNPFAIIRAIPQVASIIRQEEIDIVHARSRVPAIIGFFAAYFTRVSFITTAHGHYRPHIFSRPMGWGKRVIVASRLIGRHMLENFGVPPERIRLIPRGVNLEEFCFRPPDSCEKKELKVALIGRITPLKGPDLFLRAVARAVRVIPHLRVFIIGEPAPGKGEYREELEVLVKSLGLSDYVDFLGVRSDIPELLSQLDLLVLASRGEEAFGRVIIEAQAVGVPVVATSVGGVTDIIEDGKTGLLVPPEDFRALAEAMIKVLKDRELAGRLSTAGRKMVEKNFGLEKMTTTTISLYREVLRSPKILLIKLSALGDIILAIPTLRAVRKRFPRAKISVLVKKEFQEVFRGCPYIDEVIVWGRRGKRNPVFLLGEISKALRQEAFDIIIDLQNNRTTHILSFLSAAAQRYGYDNGKLSFLLNFRVKDTRIPLTPIKHQFRMLKLLGIKSADEKLELWPQEKDFRAVEELLSSNWVKPDQLLVGINLGGSRKWPTKRWPREYFARLADMLARRCHLRVVACGGEEDVKTAETFRQLTRAKPVLAAGKTSILELAALIKRCRVFVSGDSAAVPVAIGVGTPVIVLFGPTDPRRHLVSGGENVHLIYRELDCSPCYRKTCPHHRCLREIQPEEVLAKIENIIHNHPS